jgi:methionine-rich copper-binding protein CopC
MRSVLRGLVVTVLAVTTSLWSSSGPASAHAQLLVSSPKVSSTVYVAPKVVTLTFDDDLLALESGNQIEVRDPKQRLVSRSDSRVGGPALSVSLGKLTTYGKYSVAYHVISADGHPVTSTFFFYFMKKTKKN